MNKTLRTFILIAAILIATGQTWAALTRGTGDNLYVEPATDGTVTLYDNQGCTGYPITNAEPGSTVYIKAVPNIIHGYPTTSMIKVEKTVDSGAAQSRGAKRVSATTIGLGEYVDVTAVGNGIFSFTMPDDGTSVSITVTFPDAPVSYINAAGQTVDTGNETVHILDGSETSLDAGWYVADSELNYSQTITLNGDVHLILLDGAVMNVGTEPTPVNGNGIFGNGSISIYAQSTGDNKGQLHVNASDIYGIYNIHGNVTICGGQVTTNGSSFGINIDFGDVIICGGQVTANGSIFGMMANSNQFSDGCNVTISGGQVTANGRSNGIYANGNITISGGQVTATATDTQGYSIYADRVVTLGWTHPTDYINANKYYGTVKIASGQTLYDEDNTPYSGTIELVNGAFPINGKTLRPLDNVLVLNNDADNTAAIAAAAVPGASTSGTNVILQGRKLWKDGYWNTLVLPFPIANIEADGCPLKGATVRELNDASITGTTLTLNFKPATTAIAAGTPYIVKWDNTEATEGTEYTENPVFQGVTIDATDNSYDNQAGGDTNVRFIGTYDQKTIDTEDRSILFLGAANTLYYPSGHSATTIGACRAYFKIGSDGANNARQLTAFNFNFADGESQGITTTDYTDFTDSTGAWYSLDGVKLDGKPTKKGLYIHGGKKVVVP